MARQAMELGAYQSDETSASSRISGREMSTAAAFERRR
jgi:hypothetical protein